MVIVRKAVWGDVHDLYNLANCDDVRNASFYSEKIDFESHKTWYRNLLDSENDFIYILEVDGEFSGQVRFTYNPRTFSSKTGISLDFQTRGKNLAVNFFYKSLYLFRKEIPQCNLITAYIKETNIKSQRFFEKAGFVFSNKTSLNSCEAQIWNMRLHKAFIIAELSANHSHKIEIAMESIKAANESGADAVKIQTYTADTITIDCSNEYFQINKGTLWDGMTLYNLYKEACTPWEWHDELRDYAESLGLVFFSTPFDFTAVDFLESKNVPIYKIASFEITDIPLIEYTASKGKPMIISTGIATIGEIHEAVDACRRIGNNDITLLKCTSSYPAPVDEANLKTMVNMKETFGVKVGLSDHTMGSDVAVTAVALGAEVIEKHFILNRNIGGPDAEFSMEPAEFKSMVDSIRNVEKALGRVTYDLSEKTMKSREFSRSLFVVEDIKAGDFFTEKNIRSIRPGYGLPPKSLKEIIGRRASTDIKKGEPLTWDSVVKVFKC